MVSIVLAAALTTNAIWICIGAGVVIGLIAVLIMKSSLRSVHYQSGAGEYVTPGSFHLTASQDVFLYKTVTRVEKPQNNNKH